jgi:two-component system response regulator NreC
LRDKPPGTGATILRILIADDNDRVRRGVVGLLSSQPDWNVCGEARDGPEALLKARELLPDLVLLDLSMPGMNGLEVSRLLRQEFPHTRILVISQHDPVQLLPRVIAAGGDACVDKGRLATDLLAIIKSIGAGD